MAAARRTAEDHHQAVSTRDLSLVSRKLLKQKLGISSETEPDRSLKISKESLETEPVTPARAAAAVQLSELTIHLD